MSRLAACSQISRDRLTEIVAQGLHRLQRKRQLGNRWLGGAQFGEAGPSVGCQIDGVLGVLHGACPFSLARNWRDCAPRRRGSIPKPRGLPGRRGWRLLPADAIRSHPFSPGCPADRCRCTRLLRRLVLLSGSSRDIVSYPRKRVALQAVFESHDVSLSALAWWLAFAARRQFCEE